MTPSRPILAVTMGDAAGIGPEIVVKAAALPEVAGFCRPVAVGDLSVLEERRDSCAPGLELRRVEKPSASPPSHRVLEVVEPARVGWTAPRFGEPSAETGRAAVSFIERAVRMVRGGEAAAVVTGPINKAAIRMAGSPFPGHTEMLAHLTGAGRHAMMLVGGSLRVSLATIHVPLARVPSLLTTQGILEVIRLTCEAVSLMGAERARVAVCGLNPHAGEGGLFGDEEERVIAPAVALARAEGLDVNGPLPADTLFHQAVQGRWDAVVAMYHDQGLAPLKTLYFDRGVNVTLGLPIIRTSVDHGTAYDIAGRGLADPASLVEALRLAAAMARGR